MVSLQLPVGKKVFATHGENVLTSEDRADTSALAPCNHKEAGTRMMIHALDASLHGHRRIKIRSNDTDVVVLAISIASTLPLDELWISYGSSKQVRNLPVYAIATSLGEEKAGVFPKLTPVFKLLLMLPEQGEQGWRSG